MNTSEVEMYRSEFNSHMEKGDDPETARLRIIEQGCLIDVAKKIEDEEADEEDYE